MTTNRRDLAARLDGLLSFPVTPFSADGSLDVEVLVRHVEAQVAAGPAAVFVCCGTGEFGALTPTEHRQAVEATVATVSGRVPVLAGVGYGTALASHLATASVAAGADGLLVLPPASTGGAQDGLIAHYRAIADAAGVGVVIYQRDQVRLEATTVATLAQHPGIVGFKDGVGDLDRLQRILSRVRSAESDRDEPSPMVFVNGLPTAELTALAYRGLGVTAYSSAVHDFAPDIARDFFSCLARGDLDRVRQWLDLFYVPYVELRDRGAGYAVSLVKAGVRQTGLDVGSVRPPLTDPTPEHLDELATLIDRGRRFCR